MIAGGELAPIRRGTLGPAGAPTAEEESEAIMSDRDRVLEVVREIQHRISTGRYVPGQQLPPERSLSASLGVSRGVLREALGTLAGMGLVKGRGVRGPASSRPAASTSATAISGS